MDNRMLNDTKKNDAIKTNFNSFSLVNKLQTGYNNNVFMMYSQKVVRVVVLHAYYEK